MKWKGADHLNSDKERTVSAQGAAGPKLLLYLAGMVVFTKAAAFVAKNSMAI